MDGVEEAGVEVGVERGLSCGEGGGVEDASGGSGTGESDRGVVGGSSVTLIVDVVTSSVGMEVDGSLVKAVAGEAGVSGGVCSIMTFPTRLP